MPDGLDAQAHEVERADDLRHGDVREDRPLDEAPTPNATATTCAGRRRRRCRPPSAVRPAARRASARLIVNSTLGPGMMMMANASTAKAMSEFGDATGEACRSEPARVQSVPWASSEGRAHAVAPPSTTRTWPVTNSARPEQRKSTAASDVVGSAADAKWVGGDGLVDVEATGSERGHLLLDARCVDDSGRGD